MLEIREGKLLPKQSKTLRFLKRTEWLKKANKIYLDQERCIKEQKSKLLTTYQDIKEDGRYYFYKFTIMNND